MKSRNSISYCLFLIILLNNCNKNDNNVIIDKEISNNIIYKNLDTEKEIFSQFEIWPKDSTSKKTSDVSYLTTSPDEIIDKNKLKLAKHFNCRPYFVDSDTLYIEIALANASSRRGFTISYNYPKYKIETFNTSDAKVFGIPFPDEKLILQKLILDKNYYKINDSIFGYVDFKSIEKDYDGTITNHKGKGYFRSIVRQLPIPKN